MQLENFDLESGASGNSTDAWANGQLTWKGRLVVGAYTVLVAKLLNHLNTSLVGGHLGIESTVKRLGAILVNVVGSSMLYLKQFFDYK